MSELTGFPGIEVVVSLCFTLLLLLGYYEGGESKGRLLFLEGAEDKAVTPGVRENTKGLDEVVWCCSIWHIYGKNFCNPTANVGRVSVRVGRSPSRKDI